MIGPSGSAHGRSSAGGRLRSVERDANAAVEAFLCLPLVMLGVSADASTIPDHCRQSR